MIVKRNLFISKDLSKDTPFDFEEKSAYVTPFVFRRDLLISQDLFKGTPFDFKEKPAYLQGFVQGYPLWF